MQVQPRSLSYEVPPSYTLTTSDSMLTWIEDPAERQRVVDAFAAFKSAVDLTVLEGPERWSIHFLIGYDSESGWSFGLSVGFEF